MRLIDADKLTPRCMFKGRCDSGGGLKCDRCTDYSVEYQDIKNAPTVSPEQQWHPITEKPPRGKDLILKIYDKHNLFYYYHMGFYSVEQYRTYNFFWQYDEDLEVVGWQLCPWEGE